MDWRSYTLTLREIKMTKNYSVTISVHDLEGTVGQLIQQLQEFDKDDVITVISEPEYGYGGWNGNHTDVIQITPAKK